MITCTATDEAGNTGEATFTVTVEQVALDTTPPTINLPSDLVNGITLSEYGYTSSANGVALGPNFSPGSVLGLILSISATDNVAIDMKHDYPLGVPTLSTAFVDSAVQTGHAAGHNYSSGVWCDNGQYWQNTHQPPEDYVPIGTTTISCKAWDTSGNEATASFTITVTPLTTTVNFSQGSSSPGCEGTNSCFSIHSANINTGETVKWQNSDNAAHTVSSGNPSSGSSGHWDSPLIMSGGNYEHTFTESGTYEYFCMVHPWTVGKVVVGNDSTIKTGSSC